MEIFEDQTVYHIPEKPELSFSIMANKDSEKALVVIHDEDNTEEGIELLNKIVGALGIDATSELSVILIDDKKAYLFHQIIKASKSDYVILFGSFTNSLKTQFHVSPYKWFELKGKSILYVDPISNISDDQSKKKLLWNVLKEKFKN